jgi:hypothetical protein
MSDESNVFLRGHPAPPSAVTKRVIKIFEDTDPVQITTDDSTHFASAMVYGYKGYTDGQPEANSGGVQFGFDEDHLSLGVASGQGVPVQLDNGNRKRLSSIWAAGAIGDGIVVEYSEDFN